MNIVEWTSIISCCIAFMELIVIGTLTFATFKMNKDYNVWQRRIIDNERTPVPILESSCISDSNEYCRYYYGEEISGLDAQGQITVRKLNEKDAKEFLKKKGTVYFSNLMGENCIVLNMINDENDILLEHCSTKITCRNIGGEFQSLRIESVSFDVVNLGSVILQGDGEIFTCHTGKGETFEFYLDQVSNGSNALCHVDENVLSVKKPGMNIIGTKFTPFAFRYTKSVIRITFISSMNSYTYDIGVELKDNRFVTIRERVS